MAETSTSASAKNKGVADNNDYCISSCTGFCCKEYTVLITSLDVRRIVDHVPGIKANHFVEFYDGDIDVLNEFPRILINGSEYCLGIRVSERTGACTFQMGSGGCGIHKFSPLVCQAYPWTLDTLGNITIMNDPLCRDVFMPHNPERTKAIIRRCWKESAVYLKKVQHWNEEFGRNDFNRQSDFLRFAGCRND